MQFDELKFALEDIKKDIKDLGEALDLEKSAPKIVELEEIASQPEFWADPQESQKILKQISILKNKADEYSKLYDFYEDTLAFVQLGDEEGDTSLLEEANAEFEKLKKMLEIQKLTVLLNGEYDAKNAILTLHAGAGGTEAQDWVEMLYRMYCRWAERHKYKLKTLDCLEGDEAGIKSVSVLIEGPNAYGYLKGESGVHRLVRISPFDSSGRRHTSFASAEVIPEFDDDVEVEIAQDDLKMDVFRASGAGGQHVNKTSSAVRLTHIPTGIVVACQNERSQHQNREVALKMLKSKLMEIKNREHLEKIEDIKGVQKEIGWGSQIRSYVFMPYTLVKDHITNYEIGNINSVMDGEIDGFINAHLKFQANSG